MATPKHKLKRPSLNQVSKLVDQLTPREQEKLCDSLTKKVRRISVYGPLPTAKSEKLDKIRKTAQAALKKSGITVDDLLAEAEIVREERFAKDYPDLANAS